MKDYFDELVESANRVVICQAIELEDIEEIRYILHKKYSLDKYLYYIVDICINKRKKKFIKILLGPYRKINTVLLG